MAVRNAKIYKIILKREHKYTTEIRLIKTPDYKDNSY